MKLLGIETSCDETSAAVISAKVGDKMVHLFSNVVASSLVLHSKTGGIIPEIAAREQVKYIIPVIKRSIENCKLKIVNLDAIAITVGPGLIGSLLVGVETAKTLAYAWSKPIIPVNHLIGHIYANFIKDDKPYASVSLRAKRGNPINKDITSSQTSPDPRNDKINFPALALIVSGGHTDLALIKKRGSIKWLGGTRDDAAGEAFDKIGRLLNLPYPGGPSIEKAAKNGNPKAFNFPRPMIDSDDFDFSFSGLKTAVFREVKKLYSSSERSESRSLNGKKFSTGSNSKIVSNISASAQQAIIDVLVKKTLKATQKYKVKSILLSGGVAANQKLRDEFKLKIENLKLKIPLSVPPKHLCTDNGAMIATAAFFNYKPIPWQKLTPNPELYFD